MKDALKGAETNRQQIISDISEELARRWMGENHNGS